MLNKLRSRAQSEKGFTLIELLVVILIIGILAAIALPAFLGQRAKGQDSAAKSDARNMVSQMESFYTEGDTYTGGPGANTGLPSTVVATPSADGKGYAIVSTSKSGNTFTITKAGATGVTSRTCTSVGAANGGCNASWTS
jgi:type IV pilus assembly protein PilA